METKGKVTGLAFFFNGVAAVLFAIMAQQIINPNNNKGEITYKEGKQTINLFSY